MDRRPLAVAGVAALALGTWCWGRPIDTPAPATHPPPVPVARSEPAAVPSVLDAATPHSSTGVCAEHWLALPAGTELRYAMSVTDGSETQSGDYRLHLDSTRDEGRERIESWRATIAFEGADEPVETSFERRCSEAAGAEEPWMGLDFAGLSELKVQGWRWPAHLRAGAIFGGELRRTMLQQTLSVEREHRVLGIESVSTPAGSYDAWHVELTDHAPGGSAASTEMCGSWPGSAWCGCFNRRPSARCASS